jgi:hypothetical protein
MDGGRRHSGRKIHRIAQAGIANDRETSERLLDAGVNGSLRISRRARVVHRRAERLLKHEYRFLSESSGVDPSDAHLRKLGRGAASDLGDSQLDKLDSQVLLNRKDDHRTMAV